MPLAAIKLSPGQQVPYPDRPVATARDRSTAIARQGNRPYGTGMPHQAIPLIRLICQCYLRSMIRDGSWRRHVENAGFPFQSDVHALSAAPVPAMGGDKVSPFPKPGPLLRSKHFLVIASNGPAAADSLVPVDIDLDIVIVEHMEQDCRVRKGWRLHGST